MNTNPVIAVTDASKAFGNSQVLRGVSLTVEAGRCVAVLGPSGCGKTTLLRLVAGLETLDSGSIRIGGVLTDDPRQRVPPETRGVALVFQDLALWPHMSVRENVEFVRELATRRDRPPSAPVEELCDAVRLDPALLDRRPGGLSGGERQRAALARAMAQQPAALLLDEPLTGLDRDLRLHLIATLREVRVRTGLATLLVTHDQEEAFALADEVCLLRGGVVEQYGPPRTLYEQPASRFVAEFVGTSSCIRGERNGTSITTALGTWPAEGGPSGPVLAVIRPESVRLTADGATRGRVLDSLYRGGHWLHRIELADGAQILARGPERCAPGEELKLQAERPAFVPMAAPAADGGDDE